MNTPENSNTASPSDRAGVGVDWEGRYIACDTPWDKGRAHPALLDWLKTHTLHGKVIVPGCGAGHDVRAISANSEAQVFGIDIAPSAIARAKAHRPAGSEILILGDFLAGESAPLGPFDALFEHTCFCAIPPSRRGEYVRRAAEALRPGGIFLGIFFGNPENPNPDSPPFPCPVEEVEKMFASDFEALESRDSIPTYPEREGREYLRVFQRRAD